MIGGLVVAAMAQAATPSVAAMKGDRRVLIVSAPRGEDPALKAQRNALAGWKGGPERDVTVVEVIGNAVHGARDTAAALRRDYRLPADRFALALIGKDGHVAFRSGAPVEAERLQGTIDAMPMRRAGQR